MTSAIIPTTTPRRPSVNELVLVTDGDAGAGDADNRTAQFHINEKGRDGFLNFALEHAQDAVRTLLSRNGVDARDVCLITHQASARLMERWGRDIGPGHYLNTLKEFANLVHSSVPFNLSWGQSARQFSQPWVATLCLGPDMHASSMLLRRN